MKMKVSCLFIHGWGMNQRIWQPVIDKLPSWIDAQLMDLPGHGQRHQETFSSLQSLTDDLLIQCESRKKTDQPLLLVGWSLGALPCMQLANQQPQLVNALLLTSSNPCFVSHENWHCGIDASVFDQFAESLKEDFSGTIRRFLSLQVKGSESGRVVLRELREKVLQQPTPNQTSLDAGLALLKQLDLRETLAGIKQPVSWALGAQDGLVKAALANEINDLMCHADIKVYDKAGHAPFLSHVDEFVQQLENFAQTITK